MIRLRATSVALTLLVAASWGPPRMREMSKLDGTLREWVQHPSGSAHVWIHVRHDGAARVRYYVQRLAHGSPDLSRDGDLIGAELGATVLRFVATDPDVTGVSIDRADSPAVASLN
jgi:hypothetical protein